MNQALEKAEQEEDCFDRLPDALLLHIFNKLADVKSLICCLSVSKRFSFLIYQTDTLFLLLPLHQKPTSKPRNLFKLLVNKFIAKPLHNLFHHVISAKSAADPDSNNNSFVSYNSVNEVLKHFKDVKSLHIQLPSSHEGKIGVLKQSTPFGDNALLKWKALFGGELKTCVILGATSFQRIGVATNLSDNSSDGQVVLADEELKLRVVWIISCLIAASSRYYLFKQSLAEHDHTTIQDAMVSDVNKQGMVYMGKDEIAEMRKSMMKKKKEKEEKKTSTVALESCLGRTQVPDLSMKLWYLPVLELRETGYLMKGATLIVIRPVNSDGVVGKGSDNNVGDDYLFDFDGMDDYEKKAFDEAVMEMMKMKKSYVMTMNSF